jgi:hypothetical protein
LAYSHYTIHLISGNSFLRQRPQGVLAYPLKPEAPQIIAALGAAIIARENAEKGIK